MLNSDTPFTVIVADGRFPTNSIPLSYLSRAQHIVCCDGAINSLDKMGIYPTVIVGDMDSASKTNKEKYKSIIAYNPDQNTNDLTKAVHHCLANNWKDIVILGGTGLREDHAIGNIALLASYSELVNVAMVTNYGIFTAINASTSFSSFEGQQVSIFCLNPQTKLVSQGLLYPLEGVSLNAWWKGTLNESLGASFTLKLTEDDKVIVFRTHRKKEAKS